MEKSNSTLKLGIEKTVNIKKLLSGPHRNLKEFPLSRDVIEELKGSYTGLGSWYPIIVRPHPIKDRRYQIADGHHRVQFLKEFGEKSIRINIFDYNDDEMLRAQWRGNQQKDDGDYQSLLNTVRIAKKKLDDILQSYNNRDEFITAYEKMIDSNPLKTTYKFISSFLGNKKAYSRTILKSKEDSYIEGCGQPVIIAFLEEGSEGKTPKQNTNNINLVVSIIKEEAKNKLDSKAVRVFDKPYQAKEFKTAVKRENIPVEKQKHIAKKIKNEIKGGRDIKQAVKEAVKPKKKKQDPNIVEANKCIEDIESNSKKLLGNIVKLQGLMQKIDSKELKTLNTIIAGMALKNLIQQIQIILQGDNNGKKHQISGKTL